MRTALVEFLDGKNDADFATSNMVFIRIRRSRKFGSNEGETKKVQQPSERGSQGPGEGGGVR